MDNDDPFASAPDGEELYEAVLWLGKFLGLALKKPQPTDEE